MIKSRPLPEADNWWRGHATAFLKYVKLTDDVLRKGRVNQLNQDKCKAAYFIVVLHHLKTVVIAVRGTETPEDLITNGLCRECSLSEGDLDGLVNKAEKFYFAAINDKNHFKSDSSVQGPVKRLAVDATLRAVAPYQKLRREKGIQKVEKFL
nr:sn1-specific diacylglycerol lipase beta isoform X1 [Ipomoea batatas]